MIPAASPAPTTWPARRLRWLRRWQMLTCLLLATWAAGCAGLPSQVQRTPSRAWDAPEQTLLGRLAQERRAEARARSDSGFFLLDNVEVAFTSRLALIESAQRTLDLQYYAIHADASTELLLDRLRAAAARGVRVRVLLDDFNTVGRDAQVLRLAFVPNVEMRLFNPVGGSRASLVARVLGSLHEVGRIQKRMHNKLFIGDNAWGITGGRNLGDAYFGDGEKSNFVDLDVLAAGRIVRAMSASFDRYWNDELAYPVQALLSPGDLDRLRERTAPAPQAGLAQVVPVASAGVLPGVTATTSLQARPPLDLARIALTWAPSALLVDKPEKVGPDDEEVGGSDTVIDGLLGLMDSAQREVLVITPYFVPGPQMMAVFARLRERGVRVRVLTNSLASNDAPAAHAGYARHRPRLLRLGVELHEMRADPATAGLSGSGSERASGFGLGSGGGVGGSKSGASRASLHSKAVVVDRRLVVIGSMNLDLRSQLQNSEVALVIRSPALSRQAAGILEDTFARGAYRVVLDDDGRLLWRAPPGAPFQDTRSEPDAPFRLRLLVRVIGPFAPDEML